MTTRFADAGQAFAELCEIMATLRAPGGCPWDREQTLAKLKPYLIEETYEVIDALDKNDGRAHCEELGDLLLQVVFQAEITNEQGAFDVAQVVRGIAEKLIRRHPHVFGDKKAEDAASALSNWEAIKAQERPKHSSCLDGVPRAMPALLKALRTGEKAAAVGFDWPDIKGAMDKMSEEWNEMHHELLHQSSTERITEELGDVLFSIVNVARHVKIDPEAALEQAIEKFRKRFTFIEKQLSKQNRRVNEAELDELEKLWEEAKRIRPSALPT